MHFYCIVVHLLLSRCVESGKVEIDEFYNLPGTMLSFLEILLCEFFFKPNLIIFLFFFVLSLLLLVLDPGVVALAVAIVGVWVELDVADVLNLKIFHLFDYSIYYIIISYN